jgi:hypothetical protein
MPLAFRLPPYGGGRGERPHTMESIYQSRGFVACLKAGFTFVLANPKTVLKAMWILILIIAISDVLLYAFAQKTSVDILQLKLEPGTWLAIFGMYGTMFFQIFLAIFGLFYFGRYMVKREEKEYKVKVGRLILRNFWSFLGIFLMSSFLSGLLSLIPGITFIVCKWAYGNCVLSQMVYGDVATIPTSGYVLMMVIGAIAVAISEYLGLVVPASLIYKYGSVVYNENEK